MLPTPTPITVGRRTGTVVYLDASSRVVGPEDAVIARVVFDDGGGATYCVDDASLRSAADADWDPALHPRDDDGKFAPKSGGGSATSRTDRARRTHKPSTRVKQEIASIMEVRVARALGATRTGDNDPVDVVLESDGRVHAIEVKTLVDNANDKLTMHPSSLDRKRAWARSHHASSHTVVVDARGGKGVYYYRRGFGSFRLSTMQRVTLDGLRTRIRR